MTNTTNNVSMNQSKVAWENFKAFLGSMDMNTNKTVEMAFKRGFIEGFDAGFENAEVKPRDYIAEATASIEEIKNKKVLTVEGDIRPLNAWEPTTGVVSPVEPKPFIKPEVKPEQPKKKITRNIVSRYIRSAQERKLDGELAVEILREAGVEMPLQDIIKAAHEKGRKWPHNSASGYLVKAIEDGYNIERAGYGFYKYKGEVL